MKRAKCILEMRVYSYVFQFTVLYCRLLCLLKNFGELTTVRLNALEFIIEYKYVFLIKIKYEFADNDFKLAFNVLSERNAICESFQPTLSH